MTGGRSGWRLATVVLIAAVAASLPALPGCQARTGDGGAERSAKFVPPEQIALPPGLEDSLLAPLEGEALEHAGEPLDAILESLAGPAYLARAVARASDAEQADAAEPSLDVQRSYVRARHAAGEGQHHEAINHLDAALRLSPGEPSLLRLLSRSYGAIGNRIRAAMHLRQALEADPDHVDSLFTLGRFALEQDEPDDAIVLFHRALTVAQKPGEPAPVAPAVLHYHLAAALLEAGYATAAIEQHERYLQQAERDGTHTRHARELGLVGRQQGRTWLAIGDAHHRLGRPDAARQAYERAAAEGMADHPALVQRQVYTHLRLGQAEPAQQLVVEHLRAADEQRDDAQRLALVRYLSEHGVPTAALAEQLERLYQNEGEAGAMALAIAELLPREQGEALLRRHLARHPDDAAVLTRLFEDWLLTDGAGTSADRLHAAVELTAEVMLSTSAYVDAEQAVWLLFRSAGDHSEGETGDGSAGSSRGSSGGSSGPAAVAQAIASMPQASRARAIVQVIEGMAMAQTGRVRDAAAAFDRAMQADGDLAIARLQQAKVLIHERRYDRAGRLLEPLADSADSLAVLLRVEVLAGQGDADAALDVLDRVLSRENRPTTALILRKARLQVQAGEVRAAERTLLDALNGQPQEEAIYAALFELYSPEGDAAAEIGDWQRQWSRLVRRLLGTIPESRLGYLVRAQLLDAQGQFAEAEALLVTLLERESRDHEALEQLLEVYLRSDRRDQARELIERQLDAHGDDQRLLAVAHRFYQQIGDREQMLAVIERLFELEPAGPERARNLASLYLSTDQPDKAVATINAALDEGQIDDPMPLVQLLWRAMLRGEDRDAEREHAVQKRLAELTDAFPEHAEALLYERAMLAHQLGDDAAGEELLVQLLERDPDHAMANNALGYHWTVQNRHLEQARTMIQRAVEAEPDTAAYLDSLGWVYYKLGRFEEAVVWLRRSRAAEHGEHPVIVDHLGDALYRLGQTDEAVRVWRETQAMLESGEFSTEGDPELASLPDRVQAKLDAANAEQQPPVAPLPDEANADAEAGEAEFAR
ncbi:MAG: tetratricopeptide repeat protein [Phycisphaeraceae bacterium]